MFTIGGGVCSHAVGLRQAAVGVVSGQETVLQVDHRLPDLLVAAQEVEVVHGDLQVLLLGHEACHLKHPVQSKRKEEHLFSVMIERVMIE